MDESKLTHTTMKKRPNYIEAQIKEANEIFRAKKLKYEQKYDDSLFMFLVNHLLKHNWYNGFNMYVDMHDSNGEYLGPGLAGPDYAMKDYYLQVW